MKHITIISRQNISYTVKKKGKNRKTAIYPAFDSFLGFEVNLLFN